MNNGGICLFICVKKEKKKKRKRKKEKERKKEKKKKRKKEKEKQTKEKKKKKESMPKTNHPIGANKSVVTTKGLGGKETTHVSRFGK